MKKNTIVPHLILLSPILFMILVGILTDSGAIGMILGKIAGFADADESRSIIYFK